MVVSESSDGFSCTMENIGKMETALKKAGLTDKIHSVQLVPMTKHDSNRRRYFHTGLRCD